MRRGGARPRNVTYQRQLPLQERGQRERSSPGAARDGTGRARGGTPRPQWRDRSGSSRHPQDSHPGRRRSRCRGAGRARGRSGTWGVGAAPHRVLSEWWLGEQQPEPPPKNSPSLAHGAATFGAAAGGGEAPNRRAPGPGGHLCPGTPGRHPAPPGCRQGEKRGRALLARGSGGRGQG